MSVRREQDKEQRTAVRVVAGVLWRGGRFLAMQRPEGKLHAGRWEFPGGKVEPGESLEAALVREFEEELGLTPLEFRFWLEKRHVYTELTVHLHFFQITEAAGAPQPLEGHHFAWVAPAEAAELPFLDADAPIVRQLAAMPNSR
jgi:8-oxo-dGTP diphosphatase